MAATVNDQRYFSVDEANDLIPHLEVRFAKVMQLRSQLRLAYAQLEDLGEPATAETVNRVGGSAELVSARGRFRALVESLTEELAEIEQLGVSVKDVDIGLCDFLGQREGRDVWLCWQYGEKRVAFWHDLEAGFAGRQPLEERRSPKQLLH